MKIAFFSDIHANLPALEAVLEDIGRVSPDFIYCLGDLVGYNVWPNEVTDAIRQRAIPTLIGNYDEGIGNNSDDCGCAYKTDAEKAWGAVSISYTNSVVRDDVRQYLRQLPRQMRLELEGAEGKIHLHMAHGSPRKVNEYLFEDREEKSLARILDDAGADILLVGHTHKPYHRVLQTERNGQAIYRHVINLGSVGKPKDGDSRACYVLLTIGDGLSLHKADSLQVEFRRVPYEVEVAALAVEASVLPDVYADMLRRGY
jgi:predicted phosphodiesterase